MNSIILMETSQHVEMIKTSTGYVIGAIIALFILGYLFYSLIKPENF